MRSLRNKLGGRRGDPDRHSFAFFVVGILVVIAVAFFLGFQLGRYVEKEAVKEAVKEVAGRIASREAAGVNGGRVPTSAEIRKDMSAYSEEPLKVPAAPLPAAKPPTAGDDLKKTESEATFPESLSRKDPSPEPMARLKEKPPAVAFSANGKFMLQAGAMKSNETADALRKRLDGSGYKAKVVHVTTRKHGEVYRVRVGPFGSREEATKAMKAIKDGMKIDVILLKG